MVTRLNKQELKQKIERDLKYDFWGTVVCVIVSLACVIYFNIALLMFFILMSLVFYNSYLITKREKQIMEVFK